MIKQVAGSQKNQVLATGLALLAGASEAGLQDVVVELIGGLTALAVAIQGALDWKWGSKSDATVGTTARATATMSHAVGSVIVAAMLITIPAVSGAQATRARQKSRSREARRPSRRTNVTPANSNTSPPRKRRATMMAGMGA